MTITETRKDTELTIVLNGRLDTITAPDLDREIHSSLADVTALTFDLAGLTYISSAGLRILLSAQKLMNKQGTMTVRNVQPEIMEIFAMTGFDEILIIE